MIGGELGRPDAATAAVRPDLVVVAPPRTDHLAGLDERREAVLVEALVAEFAVEALNKAVLHGTARRDQQVLDAVLLRPGDEGPAGELRAVVGAHRPPVAAEPGSLIQHAHEVGAADAMVDRDVDALVGKVVGDRQALQAAPVGQRVADEIHAPDRVGRGGSQ